jgi:hypothetical protein
MDLINNNKKTSSACLCLICKRISTRENIKLRDKRVVCKKCLKEKVNDMNKIESKYYKLNEFKSWHYILQLSAILLMIIYFFSRELIEENFFIWLFGIPIVWILTEYIIEIKKKKVLLSIKGYIRILNPIYENMWDYPPDWNIRRQAVKLRDNYICTNCKRRLHGSTVPTHIHHIIPKFKVEGNHNINNLITLCEKCHRIQKSKGHSTITKGARYKRWHIIPEKTKNIRKIWFQAYGLYDSSD